MKASVCLCVVLVGAFILSGCGQGETDLELTTDIVYDITLAPPLPDGSPVIDIRPNGRQLPRGTGYNGSYLLVLRRNRVAYYLRWFYEKDAENGTRHDLAISGREFKPDDKLTVGVENFNNPRDTSDYVRLSNVLEIPIPPSSAPSFGIPNPNITRRSK